MQWTPVNIAVLAAVAISMIIGLWVLWGTRRRSPVLAVPLPNLEEARQILIDHEFRRRSLSPGDDRWQRERGFVEAYQLPEHSPLSVLLVRGDPISVVVPAGRTDVGEYMQRILGGPVDIIFDR